MFDGQLRCQILYKKAVVVCHVVEEIFVFGKREDVQYLMNHGLTENTNYSILAFWYTSVPRDN